MPPANGSTYRLGALALVVWLLATACWPFGDPPPLCDPAGPSFNIASSAPAAYSTVEQAQTDPACPPPASPSTGAIDAPGPPECPVGSCAAMTGEPHLGTFDEVKYGFQAVGEFVATRSESDGFEVQLRTAPAGRSVSMVVALAMQVGNQRVTMTAGREVPIRVDGQDLGLSDGEALMIESGAVVDRLGNIIRITWPNDGPIVFADVQTARLDAYVVIDDAHRGSIVGLLGDADGDPSNDLVTTDGDPVPTPPEFVDLYPLFADSWRVTDESSLFDYEDGESSETFTDFDFPLGPATVESLAEDVRKKAEAICREAGVSDSDLLDECVVDVGFTGDADYARSAAFRQQLQSGTLVGTEALAWAAVAEGMTWFGTELIDDGAGHILVHGRQDEPGAGSLLAVNVSDGSVAWKLADVEVNCGPVVTGDGLVVVQLEPQSRTAGENNRNAELVLIDPVDGTILNSPRQAISENEIVIRPCTSQLVWSNGTVVFFDGARLQGYSLGGSIELAWSLEYAAAAAATPLLSANGDYVYFSNRSDEGPRIVKIDVVSGEVVAEIDLPGVTDIVSLVTDSDGLVVAIPDPGDFSGYVVRVLDENGLSIEWVVKTGVAGVPESPRFPPQQMVVSGDRVVGYTDGQLVTAFELSNGDVAWTYRPTSFNNNGGELYADSDENMYLGPFGGDWIELISGDGNLLWSRTVEELFGDSNADVVSIIEIGPVLGGSVYVLAGTVNPLVAAVRTR